MRPAGQALPILLIVLVMVPASGSTAETQAQVSPTPGAASYPIDLATALRLAGARGVAVDAPHRRRRTPEEDSP